MRRNLQSDEFELWRVLEDSFENCTDFMAGLKLELGEPTILNESVDLAQCYFKIAAEILGMLRIITPSFEARSSKAAERPNDRRE